MTSKKTILITGASDGIGALTAQMLAADGHRVLLHGRNADKLANIATPLAEKYGNENVESYIADLSDLSQVDDLAREVLSRHAHLDVLINNAGVFKTPSPLNKDGLDVRFVVNTIAPYRLTLALLPIMNNTSRIVNLSSAAQAPVDLDALTGSVRITDDFAAYAQSKLAITMWTTGLAEQYGDKGPVFVAVNPASLLATKMVREGFGMAGNDVSIGAKILVDAALADAFADKSGCYFDNDIGSFTPPHPEGTSAQHIKQLMQTLNAMV